ncbi:MAG: hypothetical protein ACI9J3_002721 [Parvicellaceae bacterium]|jgi:hypothetical protein
MKFILASIFALCASFSYSQCIMTLQPGPTNGKDAIVFGLPCSAPWASATAGRPCDTSNRGDARSNLVSSWTYLGVPADHRAFVEFDLDSLAFSGCTVANATLVLYPDSASTSYSCGSGSTVHPCQDNSMEIMRVISSWDEHILNWVNQPGVTTATSSADVITTTNFSSPYDTVTLNLTDMVNYWLANPTDNHGLRMSLIAETYYSKVNMSSSDHPDAGRRPKLILELNCPGSCTNLVEGNVYDDVNANCNQDPGENGLSNWMVKITPGPFYAITDANGYYSAWINNSTYNVEVISYNNYLWDSVCPVAPAYNIVTPAVAGDTVSGIDFAMTADEYCTDLWVDIGSNFLRKCHTEIYNVSYCNNGNVAATGVEVTLNIPAMLIPLTSSIPWVQSGLDYTFTLGTLNPGDCGNFHVELQVSCATNFGETYCVEAMIGPQLPCTQPVDTTGVIWDKSSVSVEGECQDSVVCFVITNTGDPGNGDMDGPSDYRIYEDGILVFSGTFQINGGADTTICWPANGSTIRLEADQRPGHPGFSNPNDIIEDCGNSGGIYPLGFVIIQPEDDDNNYISIECQEVRASYDPNDKTPTPFGVEWANFISSDDKMEYKVRFQNTGNDTAFDITVYDTLTSYLDVETLIPGVSSDYYEFSIIDSNVLRFHFPNIMLPDSNVNEVESHGFFKFKIDQVPGNAPGTRIENRVGIYFDYNEVVLTNTAYNTIEYPGGATSIDEGNSYGEVGVKVYPNPFDQFAWLELSAELEGDLNFKLYNLMGELVQEKIFTGSKYEINKEALQSGVYLYVVSRDGNPIGSGKLMIR